MSQPRTDGRRFSDGGRPDLSGISAAAHAKYGDDFYVYPAILGNFAPGDPARNVAIIIQQDAAFELIELTCSGVLHGAAAPQADSVVLPITVQLTDTGAGRALFFNPIPINTICGTGKQPFILPVSKVFVPLSTVTVTAQTYDSTNTWDNVWMVLIGRRVFAYGGNAQPWEQMASNG